ncbi:MAG: VOC family protein [Thermoleophilia bacterium]
MTLDEAPPETTDEQSLRRGDFLRRAAVTGAAATGMGSLLAGPATAFGTRSKRPPKTRSHTRRRGLRDRINFISHFDVNVSDLERSRRFYEATTGLRVVTETAAEQSFPGFGITRGRFRGYMMRDEGMQGSYPMIHLVEWERPRPVGTPYLSQANVGWYRIVPLVPGDPGASEEARARVIAAGSEPFFPTTDVPVTFNPATPAVPYRVFACHDPDGTTLEFAQRPSFTAPSRIGTVAHNTTDPDRYLPFYEDGLGLDFVSGTGIPDPAPNVYSPLGGMSQITGATFMVRGDRRFVFDWLEWTESDRFPTPYREPNHLGIVRCAFEVDDIEEAYRVLRRLEPRWGRLVNGPPEEWDFGPGFGVRRVVNFTDPEGVGFQLVEQPPFPLAALHPWGSDRFD